MRTCTYTHKGWLLMCPVYLAELDTDAPIVDKRHFLLSWWMSFNEGFCNAFIVAFSLFGVALPYPILVTGKLKTTVTIDYPSNLWL